MVFTLRALSETSACQMARAVVSMPVTLSGTGGFWLLGSEFSRERRVSPWRWPWAAGKSRREELQAGELVPLSAALLQAQTSLMPPPKAVRSLLGQGCTSPTSGTPSKLTVLPKAAPKPPLSRSPAVAVWADPGANWHRASIAFDSPGHSSPRRHFIQVASKTPQSPVLAKSREDFKMGKNQQRKPHAFPEFLSRALWGFSLSLSLSLSYFM